MSKSEKSQIIRVKKDSRYFSASNEPFNDPTLSWGAKGLMGYLLSKPDDWEVRNTDLYRRSPDKKARVDRYLGELRKAGYLRRYRISEGYGKIDWITEIYENKELNPELSKAGNSIVDFSTVENTTDDNSIVEKEGYIVNTESLLNTESIKTDLTKNGASAPPSGKSNLQKENPAGRRKKDPTTSDQPPASPPAIEAYRQIARTYPEKSLWPMITQAVGEKPEDLVFWQEIVTNYIACGWNKRNVKAMLQFFTNRRIPSTQPVQAQASQQNGRSKLPPGVSSQEELDQALARFQAEEAKEKGLS